MEDLNYLYHRQQVALMMADQAADTCSRKSHLGLARAYSDRIEALRAASGASVCSVAN